MSNRNGRKPSIKQAIKQAKPSEATVAVCLRGDLVQKLHELEQTRIDILGTAAMDSMLGPPDTSEVDAEIEKVKEEQRAHTFDFRLRELDYRRWDKLETSHPPRDGHNERVNPDTFFPALIRASVVEPRLDNEDWADLLGVRRTHPGDCPSDTETDNEHCTCRDAVLSKSQFGMLTDTAVALNGRKDAAVPFSAIASILRQVSTSG